jgi:hypothetical protein
MLRVLLHDADVDYLEALRTYLGVRLPCLRPDVVLETLVPEGGRRMDPLGPSFDLASSFDFLVYNPDDGESSPPSGGFPSSRSLRLLAGVSSPPVDEGSVARLGGADRILAALLRGLPAAEAPVFEPVPVDVAPVRSTFPAVCILSSLPSALRQALTQVVAETLAARGFFVDHLELSPLDPDGRSLASVLLAPLPDGLPSITDILLDPEVLPRPAREGGPAYLLAPRRADDLFGCPLERIAEVVHSLCMRRRGGSRGVLAVCGEVPFSLVREVAGACGRLLLVHGTETGPACRAMRREMTLLLPSLPAGFRFTERMLPIDPTRPREIDWEECARILRSDLLSGEEAPHGIVR